MNVVAGYERVRASASGNLSLGDVYRRTQADNFFRQFILDPLIRIFSKMPIPRESRF